MSFWGYEHDAKSLLVTGELYPFTGGGIGRLVHNLVLDSLSREGTELHLLVPADLPLQADQVAAYFQGRVTLHQAPRDPGTRPAAGSDGIHPPSWALTATPLHPVSMELMRSLKALAAKGTVFDVVEFPDYQGWAFCTLQEKLLGRGFANTEIAVRLHSTAGIIEHFERSRPSLSQLGGFELERKALLDADRVISHLPAIAEYNRAYYGFPESWSRKVVVEFPPVAFPEAPGKDPQPFDAARPLVFGSKVQRFKRPDLFVRGAALLMRRCPEFSSNAIFACHALDSTYLAEIQTLIPKDLQARFLFTGGASAERERLLSSGIVVIPSDYESLNLLAYEVSAAGGALVVNGACPAFADRTPFVDGENCLKFDGSVTDLADKLERAWRRPLQKPVAWKANVPYWERPAAPVRPVDRARETPLVSVVITNYNLAIHLPEALASIAASSYGNIETILVDDASTESFDGLLLETLEGDDRWRDCGLRVVRNQVNLGLSASRNVGIRCARGKYILCLDADDCLGPAFLDLAVRALEVHPEFDVVVPNTAYFERDEDLAELNFCDYATFLGDVPSLGLVANRFSCATSLLRRALFDELHYNETLSSYEDWDLYLRLALAGHRFIVTNDLHFFYRRRPGSMIKGVTPERHARLRAQMLEAVPRPLPNSVHLYGLVLGPEAGPRAAPEVQAAPAPKPVQPMRHGLVDNANRALKRVPVVHSLLKRTAAMAGAPTNVELRYVVADSINSAIKRVPGVHTIVKRIANALDDRG